MVQSSLSLNPTPVSKKDNSIFWGGGGYLLQQLASYPNVFQFCSNSIIGTSQDELICWGIIIWIWGLLCSLFISFLHMAFECNCLFV